METANEMKLLEVMTLHVPDWWVSVRDMVEFACENSGGRYTLTDVLRSLLTGKMKLWLGMKEHVISVLAISEIVDFPQLRDLRIIAAVGDDPQEWVGMIEKLEVQAYLMGCKKITAIVRPGMKKLLKKFGYEETHVQLEKDIGSVH